MERQTLADQLYDVYSETVRGLTRDELADEVLGRNDARVALFYGTKRELAGFSYVGIERIEHAGRQYAVFCASVYCRLGYRGGVQASRFGLREALRFKFREPNTPLAYLTRCASPAVYRLIASTMPRVYPSLLHQTPDDVEALIRKLSVRRNYRSVGEDPWIVRSVATPQNPSRLSHIQRDAQVRFFIELNPRFADGLALLTWTPLDAANIAGGLCQLARNQFRGQRGSRRSR
ncbi:hypothetical protein [Mycobacterium sp. SMC-15]|uniref:hypothetical protein n=1 Tax=Mycobacterium sp. SMC-15 TaxID=3381627 RepID=UPI003875C997